MEIGGTMEISFADRGLLEVFTLTKKGIGLHRQNLKEAGMLPHSWVFPSK